MSMAARSFMVPISVPQIMRRGGTASSVAAAVAGDTNEDGLGFGDNPDFRSGFVSILGNANVGKSTLMNALLGERLCITSPKPQTTRHRILGIITKPEYQLIFSDTPGMVAPSYKLQEAMMGTVRGATCDADVVVLVTDVYGETPVEEKVVNLRTAMVHTRTLTHTPSRVGANEASGDQSPGGGGGQ
jgi:small GTP-binding protein